MSGRANTAAFPDSAIRLLETVRRLLQSEHSFGQFAVARMCLAAHRAPRLRQVRFGKSASDQRVSTKPQLFVRIGADRWPGRAGARRLMGLSDLCPCGPSGSFLRPVCASSRARPDSRGFGVAASLEFHGFGEQRRSGFHGGRSNWSLGRTPERHLGVNQTLPAGAGQLRC